MNIWRVSSLARWPGRDALSQPMQVFMMLAFAIGICIVVPFLVATLPFLVVYGILEWRIARTVGFARRGYFGGRRIRGTWLYEEICDQSVRSLTLEVINTEPGHWEMFFPTDEQWRASVPNWAKDRRQQIASRIAGRLKPKDFHYPPDLSNVIND